MTPRLERGDNRPKGDGFVAFFGFALFFTRFGAASEAASVLLPLPPPPPLPLAAAVATLPLFASRLRFVALPPLLSATALLLLPLPSAAPPSVALLAANGAAALAATAAGASSPPAPVTRAEDLAIDLALKK